MLTILIERRNSAEIGGKNESESAASPYAPRTFALVLVNPVGLFSNIFIEDLKNLTENFQL